MKEGECCATNFISSVDNELVTDGYRISSNVDYRFLLNLIGIVVGRIKCSLIIYERMAVVIGHPMNKLFMVD